jgi:signal transduction histidine kinase
VNDLPQLKDDVATMERNTNRLVNLTNQILDFRQTERKGFSLDFDNVNIAEVLQETHLMFEPFAKKRKLAYSLHLPSVPISTMADAEALNKIFSNLINNAVKYADREVNIQLLAPREEDCFLRIEISNDGYIIPDKMKEKIFEPFYRLKENRKQKGTGIGLALARSLVELHQGKLYVKNTANSMNVFTVTLPYQYHLNKRKNNKNIATRLFKTS